MKKRLCTTCNTKTLGISTKKGIFCPDCYQAQQPDNKLKPYEFNDSTPSEESSEFEEHEAREERFFDEEFNRRFNAQIKGIE